MDYDRLRDLQAKFDENPRRYFAPLANEYRKGGQPKRAIEICRAHLAQMPGHMSGQVVYGQALFEGAEFEEARKVFEGAIVLDPENLIALRSLGDLALQAGNSQEARTWYARLLEADPKDSDVVALVAEIDASPEGSVSSGAPAAEPEDSTFTVDFSFVDEPGATPAAADPAIEESKPVDSAVEGLTSRQPEPESPIAPIGLERHYPTDENAPPSMAEETPASGSSFVGATNNPEPFVNETMAQLYLQQGYRQLALRVYRQLAEMRPDEQALKDRIAEIEAAQTADDRGGPRARREESSVESPMPEPAAPGPSESPSFDPQPVDSPPASSPSPEPDSIEAPVRQEPRAEPEGIAARQQSIREFFATLGRRRPPKPAPAQGAWGRSESGNGPASGDSAPSTSLDAVFAGANVSSKDTRAASALAGAFSASARGTSPPPPPTSTPTPRGNPRLQSQESEEDVAKFRAWLDGLTGE